MHDRRLARILIPRTLLIAAISVAALSSSAHAQSAEAESLFADGDRLMAEGKVSEACEAFEASNRIEQRAGTLVRLGECREQNHQIASAWSAYKDALTRVKDPRKRDIAMAKVAALEPRLSYLTISVAEPNRVANLEVSRNGRWLDRGLWNHAVPIDGGTYVIEGRAPGHESWTATVEVPIEGGKVVVDVPKLQETVKPPTPAEAADSTDTDSDEETPPPRSMLTMKRKVALGLGGGGAVALVSGVVLGLQARSKQDQADALCPSATAPCSDAAFANELNHAAHGRAIAADISFGVGAALAIGAGALWVLGVPEPAQHVAIVPHVTSGEVGLVVGGSF